MGAPLLLPDSRTREIKMIDRGGVPHERLFCASCAAIGPLLIVDPAFKTYAHWLCNPCAEKFGQVDGLFMVPDDVIAEEARQIQLERYGRLLQAHEIDEVLRDENSSLSKLVRHRNGVLDAARL